MSDVLLYTYPQKDGKYRLKNTLAVASMKVGAWLSTLGWQVRSGETTPLLLGAPRPAGKRGPQGSSITLWVTQDCAVGSQEWERRECFLQRGAKFP